jgi:hypothetical protein
MHFDGVPLEMYRHYGAEVKGTPEEEKQKLREIYNWAEGDLRKITELDGRLGAPSLDEYRWDRTWRYTKLYGK